MFENFCGRVQAVAPFFEGHRKKRKMTLNCGRWNYVIQNKITKSIYEHTITKEIYITFFSLKLRIAQIVSFKYI